MNEEDFDQLRKDVLDIVFDALQHQPEQVMDTIKFRNGGLITRPRLSSKEVLTWGGKVDDLFKRANRWKLGDV